MVSRAVSFNVATLEIFLEKGFTLEEVIELAWANEGGRPKPRIPETPANDRTRRFSSADRQKLYGLLAERDEERCAECSCGPKTVWRKQGASVTEESLHYTLVWPTSNLEIDHRIPLWAGGGNEEDNLWLLCIDCHKAKTAAEASQRRRA